jgi:hypothetical protein
MTSASVTTIITDDATAINGDRLYRNCGQIMRGNVSVSAVPRNRAR